MEPAGSPFPLVSASLQGSTEPGLAELKDAAIRLEASFLSEVLKSAGMGMPRDAFGGGHGEEQFASLLIQEQADLIARAGGIGLAESIFDALKRLPDA